MAIRTIIPTITSMATIITITTMPIRMSTTMPIRMSTTIPMAMITIMTTIITTTRMNMITDTPIMYMRHRSSPFTSPISTANG